MKRGTHTKFNIIYYIDIFKKNLNKIMHFSFIGPVKVSIWSKNDIEKMCETARNSMVDYIPR